eukprot:GILI01009378.1.p1 GENE.GILI01009378.1~~GILI01009378.1.p1  ORF type:complete len:185 (+),score=21.27 GILI01009378.1:67-555(+)
MANDATVPAWMRALAEKKRMALANKAPQIEPNPTSTLDELVRQTTRKVDAHLESNRSEATGQAASTATHSPLHEISLSAISPLRAHHNSLSAGAETPVVSSPLLNEEVCAWKRCLWLQQQHQRQSATYASMSEESSPLGECAWLRALASTKVSEFEPSSPVI